MPSKDGFSHLARTGRLSELRADHRQKAIGYAEDQKSSENLGGDTEGFSLTDSESLGSRLSEGSSAELSTESVQSRGYLTAVVAAERLEGLVLSDRAACTTSGGNAQRK